MFYPLKMRPVFKEMLWGGNTLRTRYGKDIPSDKTGESWEIASHPNGQSVVANGEMEGLTLGEAMEKMGADLLGDKVAATCNGRFPLLVKIIDANDNLSVQVHPNDQQAAVLEKNDPGKTEMWYVLAAKPGARLIYGFNRDLTKEEFETAIKESKLEDVMNYVDVKEGDTFLMRSGTLHAIGAGILVAEIQQNSDTTYRVYDYNRRDAQGNPRQLHVEKALQVTNLKSSVGNERIDIHDGVKCEYFTTLLMEVDGSVTQEVDPNRFEMLICTKGEGEVNGISFRPGDSFVIPAKIGSYTVKGNCSLLRSFVTC